jgi:hypothetical protein
MPLPRVRHSLSRHEACNESVIIFILGFDLALFRSHRTIDFDSLRRQRLEKGVS